MVRTGILKPFGWIAAAVLGALIVWIIAVVALGVDLEVRFGPQDTPVTPAAVVLTSVIAGLGAWGLLLLLTRLLRNGPKVWTWVAVVVLLLSLGGPLFGEASVGTKITLGIMHLVVAAVLMAGLPRSQPALRPANAA